MLLRILAWLAVGLAIADLARAWPDPLAATDAPVFWAKLATGALAHGIAGIRLRLTIANHTLETMPKGVAIADLHNTVMDTLREIEAEAARTTRAVERLSANMADRN